MSTDDRGLTAREHNEMRDLVLAGTQRIRPASSHRAQFVAVGVSLVLIGAVSGGIFTASLRGDDKPAPVVTNSPTPTGAIPDSWVAYSSGALQGDIYLVKAGAAPHRVVGSDGDDIDQICPAFSPDGSRLASGQASGDFESGWRDAALVVTDLNADGDPSGEKTIPLDGLVRPPCPIWSPDGRWIAFGAELREAALWGVSDDVWVVDTETGEIRTLTGLAATDIDWTPDGSQLYIAAENGIRVYSMADDQSSLLPGTAGSTALAVSPNGHTLAVERDTFKADGRHDLWLMWPDGSDGEILVHGYTQLHGIGPVWSPDGNRIVFQRTCDTFAVPSGGVRTCSEQHDVVVVVVDDADPMGPPGTQTVIATAQTNDGDQPRIWFPYIVTWAPDSATLLYLAWEEIDVGTDGRGSGGGLLAVPVDASAAPTILWETPQGIGTYTAFPPNNFELEQTMNERRHHIDRPRSANRRWFPASALVLLMVVTGCAAESAAPVDGRRDTANGEDRSTHDMEGLVALAADWEEMDIMFVRPGEPSHRVMGSDDDGIGRVCPAFAPGGSQIAFGEATGSYEAGWADTALVIADVTADDEVSVVTRVGLDGPLAAPCPIWSPDGHWIAFGVTTNDQQEFRVVDQVWVVDIQTGEIRRLTGLAATDIEWAPDASELYIADEDGILVYSIGDAMTRTLDDTALAQTLAVSPDGQTLAVERRRINAAERYDLVLMDAAGSDQQVIVRDYAQMHGLGPVWSPDGNRVVFQRSCVSYTDVAGVDRICREQHDVVVVVVGDDDQLGPVGTQAMIAHPTTTEGDAAWMWFPFSVTWSPDSTTLLYLAWGEPEELDGGTFLDGLLTVSVGGDTPPVVLYQSTEGVSAYMTFPMNNFQSWSAR